MLINSNARAKMKGAGGRTSNEIPIRWGVLQGNPLSPALFITALTSVWRQVHKHPRGNLGLSITPEWTLHKMSYTDDIANLNNNREEAEELLNILWHESQKAVMSVNMAKTKVMRIVRKMQVSNTKEAEVEAALKHPHDCGRCGKPFSPLTHQTCFP